MSSLPWGKDVGRGGRGGNVVIGKILVVYGCVVGGVLVVVNVEGRGLEVGAVLGGDKVEVVVLEGGGKVGRYDPRRTTSHKLSSSVRSRNI